MSLLSLVTGPVKSYLYGAVAVLLLGTGAYVWYQNVRINALTERLNKCEGDLGHVIDVNKKCQRTVDDLVAERDKNVRTCETLLAQKDRYIKSLRTTDNLQPTSRPTGTAVPMAVGTVAEVALAIGADTIIGALNWMLPASPSGDGAHLYSAGSDTNPAHAGVVPGEVVYCTDEIGARNLLKSFSTLEYYIEALRTRLATYSTGT